MSGKKLPKGWRWAKLGESETATVIMGQSPPGSTYNREGHGLPFYQGKVDFGDVSPTPRVWCSAPRKIAEVGDILLSVRAPVGPTNLSSAQCCIGRGLAAIRGERNALTLYLYFWFKHIEPWLSEQGEGSTFTAIGKERIESLSVPLPPLPVQERIVEILRKAEEIWRKRREALELADKILPALFLEMFGDPATNPKGWNLVPLGDVLSVIRNGTTANQNIQQLGYPVTRIETISQGVINPDRVRWVQIDQEALEKWRLQNGDILFSHINSIEHIGKTAMYLGSPPDLVHGMNLLLLRADPNKCLPIYLFVYLRLQSVRDKLRSMARQAVNQASLNQTQLKSFPVMLPPLEMQRKLEVAVDQNQLALSRLVAMDEEADMLFQNLLSRAFTGELTAEWEAANAEEIAKQQAFHERLPRLLLLALLAEKAKRASRAAAEVLVTALMKYVFLLQMEGKGDRRRLYHFVPYHYGPFAKELYADLKKLQAEGLVTVDNDSEEEKTRIALADPGKADQALAELPDDLKEDVAAIIENYGNLDHNSLLKRVYEKYPAYARKSRLHRRLK